MVATMPELVQRDDEAATSPLQFILCRISNQACGIQITTVREIIRLQPVRQLPDMPPHIQRIIKFRGEVISIVDLPTLLGLAGGAATEESRIVILDMEGHSIGFAIDSVTEVTTIDRDAIEKVEALDLGAVGSGVAGIAQQDDHMVILLDIQDPLQGVV